MESCPRSLAVAVLLAAPAAAQGGTPWAEVVQNPAKLAVTPSALSDSTTEVDFATGDLDRDGWTDAVVVRGPGGSSVGFRTNFLLMNVDGVLQDKTATLATASDVPGDQGFLELTNDRDLVLADVDLDGWLDVITAPTLSDGLTKAVSHPRVYVNQREDSAGNWLGLKYEEARIPQLFTVGGLPVAPRFCDVDAGDVNGDGAPDLYFIDYDQTQMGSPESPVNDLNDRFLINDGNGFFTDESALRFTTDQLLSNFGHSARILDLNGDGALDVFKVTALGPYDAYALYNDPGNPGMFQALGKQGAGSSAPYGMDAGDLNGDGRIDFALQDDAADRYRLNLGNDELGRVIWGPLKVFQFAGGSDDGFGHKVRIHDFDGDGFAEVFICDFDIEFLGCQRRLHVYHNLGGAVGGDVTLREEAELTNPSAGWKSIKGLSIADMNGTMDVGLHDFDKDGDTDMLLANCNGTVFWENQASTATVVCQQSVGYAGPGPEVLSLCGDDLTTAGSTATLELTGAPAGAPVVFAYGLFSNPIDIGPGTLVPNPVAGFLPALADVDGVVTLPVPGGANPPNTVYIQAGTINGFAIEISNAVEAIIGTP